MPCFCATADSTQMVFNQLLNSCILTLIESSTTTAASNSNDISTFAASTFANASLPLTSAIFKATTSSAVLTTNYTKRKSKKHEMKYCIFLK